MSKEPELEAAKEELKKLDKKEIVFMSSLKTPPDALIDLGKLAFVLEINEKCKTEFSWTNFVNVLKDP